MFIVVDIEVATILLHSRVAELWLLDSNLIAWERLVTETFIWELDQHTLRRSLSTSRALTHNLVLLDKLLAALGPRLDSLLNLVSDVLNLLDDVFSRMQDRVEKVLRATKDVAKDVFSSLSEDRVEAHAQLSASVLGGRGRSRNGERGE